CAGCHAEIAKSYLLTGMGRSLYRPRAENQVEDFKTHNRVYNRASDRYYTMLERDGKWYQRRHQIGFDGKEINIVEKAVDYVMGSGNHVRSYLSRTVQGTLVELPVSWYTENGGYWAMSPGYDRANQEDFRRTIISECLACHTGYPAPAQGFNLTTNEPVFGDRIPEGIDCQRCHGPGRAHIDAAGSGHASLESIRAAIVNPAKLNRDRQLEVCMQCHLETTHFPLPNQIVRYSQRPFSYRPGEPLGDYELFFDHAPGTGYDDTFEIVHAAYRLRKSACFQASQMTCTTCHNPHSIPREEEAAEHYTAVCRNCHATAHEAKMPTGANSHEAKMPTGANSCVECHMPKRRPEDVVHTVMTDHYIQRRPPARDVSKPIQEDDFVAQGNYRGEVTRYYPPQLPRTPENQLYQDVAQVYYGANLKSGTPRLQQDLEKYQPEPPEFYVALGDAYMKANNYDQAIRWYEEALRRRADFRPALEELGGALTAAGRLDRAVEVLEKAAAPPLPNTAVLTNLGGVYFMQGNLDRAEQRLQQALGVNHDLPEAHNFLGLVLVKKGDWSGAENHFREAISIQPDFAEAQYNLANVLAGASQYSEAQYHFQKAIAIKPEYVEAHHHYGILLAQMGSTAQAVIELQETVRLDPNLSPAYNDLGGVLAVQGRLENAADAYQRAIRLNPDFYEAHLALGQILERKGDVLNARAHYEKAAQSPDPSVRDSARKALR
ncbi:MAG: tetratricopeptide repeat protein, partial [Bryobacteraceae bacterium]